MLYSICQKLFYKIRQEAVLSIAVLLALLSACFVLPDASYFGYIDFRTLTILFSLMTVMAGLQRQGVFTRFAYSLLSRTNSITSLVFVLVGLCFFCSMLITNDLRSVLLCCTGAAAGNIRQKTPDARCLPADYCRQPRQHADSHREPSEFISVWQKPAVLFRFFAAHAPLYAAVCHPAFCLHFLSGTSASAANSLFLNPESDYKRCTKKAGADPALHRFVFLLPPCRFACASLPGSLCPRPFGRIDRR